MSLPDDELLELALSVVDGKPVDWAARQSSGDEDARRILERLADVEALLRVHQGTAEARPDRVGDSGVDAEENCRRWGRFEILTRVGGGSYGDVYRARDTHLGRDVALKLLRYEEHPATGEPALVREAHLLARVRHPNVVTVYGAERIGGRTGIWMEFVEGETLEDQLRGRGCLAPDEVAGIGIALAAALQAVHLAGLVHGDVKAQNVMRDGSGRLVLMDFGAGHDTGRPRDRGVVGGTPAYLAPELLAGGEASIATDIYAVGVVLFRLLTGRFPVEGSTLEDIRCAHFQRTEPASALPPGIPRALRSVISRALAPDPSARFFRAREMELALQRTIESRTPERIRLALAATVLLAVVGAFLWLIQSRNSDSTSPQVGEVQQRLVWGAPDAGAIFAGSVSADGRYASSLAFETGALVIRDLHAGTTRIVAGREGTHAAEQSVLSRDGTQVAFTWRVSELRVASTTESGEAPRSVLIPPDANAGQVLPCDWSPDNTRLLYASRKDNGFELKQIDLRDGSIRLVTTGFWGIRPRAVYSTSGDMIAVSMASGPGELESDIYLLPSDGGTERLVISNPGHDVVAGWSPDGTALVFLSERGGSTGLWKLQIADGHPEGDPVLLRPDISGTPIGLTTSGALFLAATLSNRDLYVASVDFTSGRTLTAPTRPVTRYVGSHRAPLFSPDGSMLAYVSTRTGLEGGSYLVLQSIADGTSREIRLAVNPMLHLSWIPDGTAIIGIGKHADTAMAVYRVHLATGETTELLRDNAAYPQLSRDATKLYFVRPVSRPPFELIERQMATGDERVLFRNPALMCASLSPDGRRVAVVAADAPGFEAKRRLKVIELPGGLTTELFEDPRLAFLARWAADGESLVTSIGDRVAAIPVAGGPPRQINLQITPSPQREEHLSIHPDGKRIAYMAGTSRVELWSFESLFTPAPKQ